MKGNQIISVKSNIYCKNKYLSKFKKLLVNNTNILIRYSATVDLLSLEICFAI